MEISDIITLAKALNDPSSYDYGLDRRRYCHYCFENSYSRVEAIQHTPDCPVSLARKVLAELGEKQPPTLLYRKKKKWRV